MKRNDYSVDYMKSRFKYDPATGILTFKPIALKAWNSRRAGKPVRAINHNGYVTVHLSPRRFLAHRIAWAIHYGAFPDGNLDHRDGDRTNNRIDNLRLATAGQNMMNRKSIVRTTDLPRGVTKKGKRFTATVRVDGKTVFSCSFRSADEAHQAYLKAVQEHHGEFAFTNGCAR